jgi:hypothetical protein
MSSRPRIAAVAVTLALVGLAGCGDDGPDGGDLSGGDTTSTTASTSTSGPSTTTTAPAAPPSTTAPGGSGFDGATTPTSVSPPPGLSVALLSDVEVSGGDGIDQVRFTFEDAQIPGYDVAYIDPPVRQDGSGDEVEVEGDAFLSIRFAPASGVDLLQTLEPTYTGPGEVRGDTEVVTEVVRTGDFEANLTWVVGVNEEVPYRVESDPATGSVTVELSAG